MTTESGISRRVRYYKSVTPDQVVDFSTDRADARRRLEKGGGGLLRLSPREQSLIRNTKDLDWTSYMPAENGATVFYFPPNTLSIAIELLKNAGHSEET